MDTLTAAKHLIKLLKKRNRAIVLLDGEMGAGKTTLVSHVMKELAPNAHITSPTFTLINQYADNIFHMDLYRIEDDKELENIGFWEIVGGDNIVFIEWPKKFLNRFCHANVSNNFIHVKISQVGEYERKITVN